MSIGGERGSVLGRPLTNPHQFKGGGKGTAVCTCRLRSSLGMPLKPGARVGSSDIPTCAMRPVGVGSGSSHGIARVLRSRRIAAMKVGQLMPFIARLGRSWSDRENEAREDGRVNHGMLSTRPQKSTMINSTDSSYAPTLDTAGRPSCTDCPPHSGAHWRRGEGGAREIYGGRAQP